MKVHNDDTKAREKLFTELRMAKKQEDLAHMTTMTKAAEVTKHIIGSLKDQLNNAAGQRFAMVFDGIFPHTMMHGPRANHAEPTSFKTTYIGVLSSDPGAHMTGDEPTSLNAYEISTTKLFVSGKGVIFSNREFERESGLWLKYYERDHPSWDLTDIAAALAPSDIKEILKPKNSGKHSSEINVTLFIGNAKFEEYLDSLRQDSALKVRALMEEDNPSSAA